MPRTTISFELQGTLEAPHSRGVGLLAFKVSSPRLIAPVAFIGDTVDYVIDGLLYQGVADLILGATLISDDDQPPRTRIDVMNVDRAISETVLALADSPRIDMAVYWSADFDLSKNPRVALGVPQVLYMARRRRMTNVSGGALTVGADIEAWNLTREIAGYTINPTDTPAYYR